jgi:hypothetical protein
MVEVTILSPLWGISISPWGNLFQVSPWLEEVAQRFFLIFISIHFIHGRTKTFGEKDRTLNLLIESEDSKQKIIFFLLKTLCTKDNSNVNHNSNTIIKELKIFFLLGIVLQLR